MQTMLQFFMRFIPSIVNVSVLYGILTAIVPPLSAAEMPLSSEVRLLYQEVTEYILLGEYERAQEVVENYMSNNLNDPAGPLIAASVIQYKAVDYEDYSLDDEYFGFIDKTIELADARLDEQPDDPWAVFYRAAASGLAGAHASLTGRVLTGIIRGRSATNAMSRLIDVDSTFYDAYLMVGSYHFWKSVATSRITWLPFIDDEREEGIAEVELAVKYGEMAGPLANTVLLEMLLEHDHERAMRLASELSERYPSCRLFAWQLGEAYKRLGQFDEARVVFERIAESFINDPNDDGSGQLRCWWKLADLADTIGDCELSVEYCRRVIEIGRRQSVASTQKERIDRAGQIFEECNK